jgi:predicted MFS family arabinose efflux permease
MAHQRRVVWLLTVLGACYVYSTLIMAPLLLQLAGDLGVTVGTAGLAAAAYGIPSILLGTVAGPYSDRYGRKRFLIVGSSLLGAATFAAALAPTLELLVMLRFCAGIGAALCVSSMQAALADNVSYRERGSAIAMVSTGGNLFVNVVGLPVAGILAEATSWRVSLGLVGVLALLTAAALSVWLPRSRSSGSVGSVRRLYAIALSDRSAMLLLWVTLLAGFAWTGWASYVIVFFQRTFDLPQGLASTFAITTGIGFFVGGQLGGRIGDRRGNWSVSVVGLVAGAACYALLTRTWIPLALAVALNAVLVALIAARVVTVQTMLSERVPAARGTLMAIFGSVNAMAATGGVALAGLVIDAGGFGLFGVVAAGLLLTALVLLVFVRERSMVAREGGLPEQPTV